MEPQGVVMADWLSKAEQEQVTDDNFGQWYRVAFARQDCRQRINRCKVVAFVALVWFVIIKAVTVFTQR